MHDLIEVPEEVGEEVAPNRLVDATSTTSTSVTTKAEDVETKHLASLQLGNDDSLSDDSDGATEDAASSSDKGHSRKSSGDLWPEMKRSASTLSLGSDCTHFIKPSHEVKETLAQFKTYLHERTENHLGYPYNLEFEAADLHPFLEFSINNLGDPFVESNYGVHSRTFEIEVLDFFASLWKIDRDEYWGYTTTCGTEGNLLGILYGREKLPEGVLYCSADTHYSIPKAAKLYRIPLVIVKSDPSGEMDYDDLREKLAENKDKPAIISVNVGTTVKGAVDDLTAIQALVFQAGFSRERTYFHVDGALAGLLLPFYYEEVDKKGSKISFEDGVDSMSVSGHKMLGCPMPCGVVITRKEHMERFSSAVEYLNSNDTTIMGSRNGQASLAMWYALQRKNGVEGLRADAIQCAQNATYLYTKLSENNVPAMLNRFSTTVVFQKPTEKIVRKWQLACTGNIAHVVVMPSADRAKLDRFLEDYLKLWKSGEIKPLCCANHIGSCCPCKECKP